MGKLVLALAFTLTLSTAAFAQGGGGTKGFKGEGGSICDGFAGGNEGTHGFYLLDSGLGIKWCLDGGHGTGLGMRAWGGNGVGVIASMSGGGIRPFLNREGAGSHPALDIAQGAGTKGRKSGDGTKPLAPESSAGGRDGRAQGGEGTRPQNLIAGGDSAGPKQLA